MSLEYNGMSQIMSRTKRERKFQRANVACVTGLQHVMCTDSASFLSGMMRSLQSLVSLVPRQICTSSSVVGYFSPRVTTVSLSLLFVTL